MFTIENRFQVGMNLLKQFNKKSERKGSKQPVKTNLASFNINPSLLSLGLPEIIDSYGPFPPYTTILGICPDGLPMILNLMHPATGSFLVLGDSQSGKTALLHSILDASIRLNKPDQVSSVIITGNAEAYSSLLRYKHCKRVVETAEHHAVYATLSELAGVLDKRRYHNSGGPTILLIIDELTLEMGGGTNKFSRLLYKLIRHGPRYHIWSFLSLPAQKINQINPQFLGALHTYILGYTKEELSTITGQLSSKPSLENLKKGKQFKISYSQKWIDLWLPKSTE
jgi:hypothetical protein